VEGYDASKELAVIRMKLRNGDQILYPGYVSITPDPTMERNNVMTRTISVGLSARSLRYLPARKEHSWRRSKLLRTQRLASR
jgi:hypothetical protein